VLGRDWLVRNVQGDRHVRLMRMRSAIAAIVATLFSIVVGAPGATSNPPRADSANQLPEWAQRAASNLSLHAQVGQLLIVAFHGEQAPRFLRQGLVQDRVAGTILFGGNVRSRRQVRSLTKSLQRAAAGAALISVDQEGGEVRRIPFAGPRGAQPRQGSAGKVRRIAREAATDLAAAGINVNFAPVADVPAAASSDITPRAFAGSPGVVAKKVVAAVRGYRAGRVAATVKHFPGLGTAPRNTDRATVVIRRSWRELSKKDLVPFRAAVAEKVSMVMASHAVYTALDGRHLASQSRKVLQDLLRKRLGFDGVVTSDALEARAVLARGSVPAAAERSLRAGCDLLLLSQPGSYGPVFKRIFARAQASDAVRARVREAAARVLVLKQSLGLRTPGVR
jgi:beta-N-acetylhexosaminidase